MSVYSYVLESSMKNDAFAKLEKKYKISISKNVKKFIIDNGGKAYNKMIKIDDEEYEVRAVLSIDNGSYSIKQPFAYYMDRSNKKYIPVAIDSGDNYYLFNLSNGSIYRDSHESEKFSPSKLCSLNIFAKALNEKSVSEVVTERTRWRPNDELAKKAAKEICDKVKKIAGVKSAKVSDWHGTSIEVKHKIFENDKDYNSFIKKCADVFNSVIKKLTNKELDYSWDDKVYTKDSFLWVVDCYESYEDVEESTELD